MIQYGDIRTLSGYTLEPVDLIVGGSPCQNLSIAGNRKGLEGSESGLFLEMIRIIREMREQTNGVYPRYALWENVPGAFTSNDGRDFSVVLGEFARLIEPSAPDVSVPTLGWKKAGVLLVGDGQIAYRTHNAQFWGTPQRRERVALIVSFRDQSASEILFERKSLSGDTEQSETQRERTPGTVEKSTDVTISFQERCGKLGGGKGILLQKDHIGALSTLNNQYVFDSQPHHDYREMGDVCQSVSAQYGTGGNNMPFVVNERGEGDTAQLMTFQAFGVNSEGEGVASSLKQRDYKDATDLVVNTEQTLTVRRLTPLEATRLQGYPDDWLDIPGASDSAKYKALGNSICLPFWEHLARRFAQYGNVQTIGSLFAGIGGFELVFKRAGVATAWSSEIESFCQRVVAYHTERGDL